MRNDAARDAFRGDLSSVPGYVGKGTWEEGQRGPQGVSYPLS